MSDMAQISSTSLISNRKTIGQRLLPAFYVSTLLIAMAGWLWEIGRVLVAAVDWLLA